MTQKLARQRYFYGIIGKIFRRRGGGLAGLLVAARVAGQDVLPAPEGLTSAYSPPGPLQQLGIYQAPPAEAVTLPPLWHAGELSLRPHPDYRFLYGDGIPVSTNHSYTTAIQELTPGFAMTLGQQWLLDYSPTERLYSNRQFQDALDQHLFFRGGVTNSSTVFNVSQNYAHVTTPLVETATAPTIDVYGTQLSASHRFNSQWSVQAGLYQDFRFVQQLQGYRNWSTMDWLSYQISQPLSVGLGLGGGYSQVIRGYDSVSEQEQARVNWRPTPRFGIGLSGGVEERQFDLTGSGVLINPLFGASIFFEPATTTRLALDASRSIQASLLPGVVTELTSLELRVTQTISQRFKASVDGGYHYVSYVDVRSLSAPVRSDDGYTVNLRLSWLFSQRGTASLLYRYRTNESSQRAYSLTGEQVGFELAYRY